MSPKMRSQLLVTLFSRRKVERFRFADERANPIDLIAVRDRPADAAHHFVQALDGDHLRGDRLAAGGLLIEHRHVHVAEIGERQGARDRGRGHHQNVDGLALGAERQALVDAEAVLLVDDRDAEILERDALLKQRVGADRDLDRCRRPGRRARPGVRLPCRGRSAARSTGPHREPWGRCARNAGAPEFPSAPSRRPAARPRWRSPSPAGPRRSFPIPHRLAAGAASSCRRRDRGEYPRQPSPARR